MNRNLILPAGLAAGMHALLLWGFRSSTASTQRLPVSQEESERFRFQVRDLETHETTVIVDRDRVVVPPPPPFCPPRDPEIYVIDPADDGRPHIIVPPLDSGSSDHRANVTFVFNPTN